MTAKNDIESDEKPGWGILKVFYGYFEKALVKILLNIGIFGRMKICLVFDFCSFHFTGIGFASVSNFPKNSSSN